mmetsp:Transcript_24346/g.79448  ORF Transcript_24346/g.79448 Transcript_24346/m.79448 type:complete len:293 (+) Transcript_24346:851-1729(+)
MLQPPCACPRRRCKRTGRRCGTRAAPTSKSFGTTCSSKPRRRSRASSARFATATAFTCPQSWGADRRARAPPPPPQRLQSACPRTKVSSAHPSLTSNACRPLSSTPTQSPANSACPSSASTSSPPHPRTRRSRWRSPRAPWLRLRRSSPRRSLKATPKPSKSPRRRTRRRPSSKPNPTRKRSSSAPRRRARRRTCSPRAPSPSTSRESTRLERLSKRPIPHTSSAPRAPTSATCSPILRSSEKTPPESVTHSMSIGPLYLLLCSSCFSSFRRLRTFARLCEFLVQPFSPLAL